MIFNGKKMVSGGLSSIPLGTITAWALKEAPAGWNICDGIIFLDTQYSAWAVLARQFEPQDGVFPYVVDATHCRMPNLKEATPYGAGTRTGETNPDYVPDAVLLGIYDPFVSSGTGKSMGRVGTNYIVKTSNYSAIGKNALDDNETTDSNVWSALKVGGLIDGIDERLTADELALSTHKANTNNPHATTKTLVGLGSVPNKTTNAQTPTFTIATLFENIASGETLAVIMGKIQKAITMIGQGGLTSEQVFGYDIDAIPDATGATVPARTMIKNNNIAYISLRGVGNPLAVLSSGDWINNFYAVPTLNEAHNKHLLPMQCASYVFDLQNGSKINHAKLGQYSEKALWGIVMDGHTLGSDETPLYNSLPQRYKDMYFIVSGGQFQIIDRTGRPMAAQSKGARSITVNGSYYSDGSNVQGNITYDAIISHAHNIYDPGHGHGIPVTPAGIYGTSTGAGALAGTASTYEANTNISVTSVTSSPIASENLIKTLVGSPWILAILA